MGVDAGIFAKKAKKYFWFDRLYNIERFFELDDQELVLQLDSIKHDLMEKDNKLVGYQIIRFLKFNIEAWIAGPQEDRYHAEWVKQIIEFVEAHPDDNFFVATDHTDAYDLIGEMHGERSCWTGQYNEWKS